MTVAPSPYVTAMIDAVKLAIFVGRFIPNAEVQSIDEVAAELEPALEMLPGVIAAAQPAIAAATPLMGQVFQLMGKHMAAGASMDEAAAKVQTALAFHLRATPEEEQQLFQRAQGAI